MQSINKIKIDPKYLPFIGRLFTPLVLDSLVQKRYSGYLSEVCANSGLFKQISMAMTVHQFFDRIYKYLLHNYRNEYIYKNAIANRILLEKHSLNASRMLTEFRVGQCKADAVILNGTSTVYEIKSEYDTFARLENQVKAYMAVFEHINVITSASQVVKLKSLLPFNVGILVLTNKGTIEPIRESKSNIKNIKLEILFDSLRKTEYLKVIKDFYDTVPNVPNTQIYRECKNLYGKIPLKVACKSTIDILKNRSNHNLLYEFTGKVPTSLSAYAMSISTEKEKMQALISLFDLRINTILAPNLL